MGVAEHCEIGNDKNLINWGGVGFQEFTDQWESYIPPLPSTLEFEGPKFLSDDLQSCVAVSLFMVEFTAETEVREGMPSCLPGSDLENRSIQTFSVERCTDLKVVAAGVISAPTIDVEQEVAATEKVFCVLI